MNYIYFVGINKISLNDNAFVLQYYTEISMDIMKQSNRLILIKGI